MRRSAKQRFNERIWPVEDTTHEAGAESARIRELEVRVRQLELLQEAAQKVSSILDLEELLDEIVGSVAETFGCTRTAVLLKDESRDELEMIAMRGFSNLHLKGYRFRIGAMGMVGHVAATRQARYAPDVRKDPFYVPSEPSTLSEVDIPLTSRGKFIGVFDVQSSVTDAFSPEQIELLRSLADTIAIAVENARLFKQERAEKEKVLREQEEACRFQRALFPETTPKIAGYVIDGMCLQLRAVGGDWYDYFNISDGMCGVSLGDVCGKGMAAALLMAAARALFRRAAFGSSSPGEVLNRTNTSLLKQLPDDRYVTMVFLILDASTGVSTIANAGHPYPILIRHRPGTNTSMVNTANGFPLGVWPGSYEEMQVKLEPGDRLLIYSDGVLEAANLRGEEYGAVRLPKVLQKKNLSAKELLTDVKEFTQGGVLADDATAIMIRREQ